MALVFIGDFRGLKVSGQGGVDIEGYHVCKSGVRGHKFRSRLVRVERDGQSLVLRSIKTFRFLVTSSFLLNFHPTSREQKCHGNWSV